MKINDITYTLQYRPNSSLDTVILDTTSDTQSTLLVQHGFDRGWVVACDSNLTPSDLIQLERWLNDELKDVD